MKQKKTLFSRLDFAARLLLSFFLAVFMISVSSSSALAGCNPCKWSNCGDVMSARSMVMQHHVTGRTNILNHIANEFNQHRNWLTDTFFKQQVLPALQAMTEQLSAVAMHQVFIVGTFFDAKQQLETQQLFQELQVNAHRDYQPSEDFCWFGTAARSLAPSEQRSRFSAAALSARQLGRQLGNANLSGGLKRDQDRDSRWEAFVTKYCDPRDNNWEEDVAGTGLRLACGSGGGTSERINIDIDFTRLIEEPRTLNVSFADSAAASPDEQDVLALGSNLYGHDVLTRNINSEYLRNRQYQQLYMALRSVAAKRAVAENSYNSIVGLKSSGSSDSAAGGSAPRTREFLAAIVKELGVTDPAQVYEMIGQEPSYFAQLELLAKKIYQNPDFYANLYDKPANVARKSVALKAIELMLDRAIFESQLRQEMAMSVLLSAKLNPLYKEVNEDLSTASKE